jgi:glycosyltransferase involved in cell wall biosynthesis
MNQTNEMNQTTHPKIAAVIITKDEERNIAACLESLRWVDEIIVVDACSVDRTVDIARSYTDRVFVRPWSGYGPQKNFGIDQARADWILIVDADERVTEELREEILRTLRQAPPAEVAGYEVPRRNVFYGKWIRGSGYYPDYQLRLFRRAAGRYDDVLLHEHLRLTGRVERLAGPLNHDSMPTIGRHVRKMMRYTTLGAQEKLKRSSRVTAWEIGAHHLGTILKTYLLRRGYRDGIHGLLVALFAGLHTFVKYAKAWEFLNVKRDG